MVMLRILFFTLMLTMAFAATWIGKPPQKPAAFAHKEGCYVKEINDVISYGEDIVPLGYCYRIGCSQRFIDYASCSLVSTEDPNCYVTDEDTTQVYPYCCPTVKCEVDNNITNVI